MKKFGTFLLFIFIINIFQLSIGQEEENFEYDIDYSNPWDSGGKSKEKEANRESEFGGPSNCHFDVTPFGNRPINGYEFSCLGTLIL